MVLPSQWPPRFSGHSWGKGFASNPPASVPGSPEVPLLGVGGGGECLLSASEAKAIQAPSVANLCSDSLWVFSCYWESSYKGDKMGLLIQCVGLEIRKTRAPNPATSCCRSGQGLTCLSFRSFLCRTDLPVRALPRAVCVNPQEKLVVALLI